MEKGEYVCPQCGSTHTKDMIGYGETPTARKCNDCGYMGICPIIPKDKIKEFQKKLKNK